ncbi:SCO family protein [Streptomyces pactum]|uniref:SCO family protein n=1 Tax=Streptomyces pactum TaxID=68249 RepID=A0ABS0NKZ0_9ACTN|nr:SCO family protein [Streptomyces pactum]MBH5335863.1 SCO family protein [Streptomyces pactum]
MRIKILAALTATAAALTLTACGGDGGDKGAGKDGGDSVAEVSGTTKRKSAIVLDTPRSKPDLVLKDTEGKEYDLLERTKGRPTLVYFGYTYCPDVCSLVMSNIAIAEAKLSPAEREKLQVIFVTTDPARDTPKRMRAWLDGQGGKDFVGLTGDFDTIQAAARPLGIFVEKPKKEKDGSITVQHGAEVVAFSPKDDRGRWIYTTETTSETYAKDLPKIVKGVNP